MAVSAAVGGRFVHTGPPETTASGSFWPASLPKVSSAREPKPTSQPLALIVGAPPMLALPLFSPACPPEAVTLTRVTAPPWVSITKTSSRAFVSSRARLEAEDANVT